MLPVLFLGLVCDFGVAKPSFSLLPVLFFAFTSDFVLQSLIFLVSFILKLGCPLRLMEIPRFLTRVEPPFFATVGQ